MIKVEHLTETELEEIGKTYANYNYPENDKDAKWLEINLKVMKLC